MDNTDETVIRERKRQRRVSFAENTEIFFLPSNDDDELSGTPPPNSPPPPPPPPPPPSSNHHNPIEDDDDDESLTGNDKFQLSSSPGSVTSNDENAFFGPVVPSFIRLGSQLESPADDHHDNLTLDSNAFSMHFQSLARSDSSAGTNCKTPTPTFQGRNTDSKSYMVMTQVKKRLPFASSSTPLASDSNHMLLVPTSLSNQYNYGSLSPSLNSFLVQIEKEKHHTPQSSQHNHLYADSKIMMQLTNAVDTGDSTSGHDSKGTSPITKSPSMQHYTGRVSTDPESSPQTQGRNRIHKVPASDQMIILKSPNRTTAENKVQLHACNGEELSNFASGDSANELNSNDMFLIRKSPSNKNEYGRISPSLQSPQVESRKDRMSILKPTQPLGSGSKPAQEVSKFEVLNSTGREHATDGRESDEMILIRDSPNKYNYSSPSHTLWSPQGASRNECIVGRQEFETERDSIGGHGSDGMILISNSPSNKYDYNRLPRASVSPHAENGNHMRHTFLSDQWSNFKPPKSLVAESKAGLHASIDKELSETDSTGESPFNKYGHKRLISTSESLQDKSTNYMQCTSLSDQMIVSNSGNQLNNAVEELHSCRGTEASSVLARSSSVNDDSCIVSLTRNAEQRDYGKLSLSLESQLAQGIKDTHHPPVSDLKDTTKLAISHAQPPTIQAQSLPSILEFYQSDQMTVSKSPSNLNTDKIVQVPHTLKNKEVNDTDIANPPTLMRGFAAESQMVNSPVQMEVEKSEGHKLQGQWDNALKEVPAAVEKLLFPLIDKLNSREVDILEDMLGRMQKAIKYEKPSALVQFQRTNDPCSDDHQRRVLEATWLQETLVYEQAKLILLRTKQEQLQKQIQVVQSGIQETQKLKISTKNILDGAKNSQNKDVMLPSLLVDLSMKNMDKVSAKEQEVESADIKIKNLSKSLLCGCKIKEEANGNECIVLVNKHLKKKTRCRLLQRKLQVYQVDCLERENDDAGCNLHVNYYNLLCQSFGMRNQLPKLVVTSNKLKTENIKSFIPSMNAGTAFAFVFKQDESSSSSNKRSLGLETQVIRTHLHNLLMVIGEVEASCMELRNLIQATFVESECNVLQLEVCFVEWKTGNKVTILVDMTCLKSGVYPRRPQISFPASEFLFLKREIEAAAVEAAGCLAVYKLCGGISQLLLASFC